MTSKQYFAAEELHEFLDSIFNPPIIPIFPREQHETISKKSESLVKVTNPFEIQSVLSNHKKNAFTVVWTDGTHTTVHCQPGDDWDDEKALAMCFTKKALGNKGNFNDKFNDALDNKMKTIRAEKEVKKPATVCAKEQKAVEETKATTVKNLSEKISSLEILPQYKLFIRSDGEDLLTGCYRRKKTVKEKVRNLARDKFGRAPFYYRTWMEDDKLVIDFGSHSTFIVIEGMTSQEWIED